MTGLGPGAKVGPYRLGRLLGRGGMAVVYEATDESVGRTVALKLIASELADVTFVERFRTEGRMQAALDHPHVVTVYEAGTSAYGPYLAMELVEGTTLAGLIDHGALDAERTLRLLEQVALALDGAHAAGLVHRDVKPRNILVDERDHAYLADFGLTRLGDTTGATATGQFVGTLAYVAPEIIHGEPAGPASDRYALAAVLFECLSGSIVFPRPTQAAMVYAHTSEPPPQISRRRTGVPPPLDDVLLAGLAKAPDERPATATELIARARKALAGTALGPPAPRAPAAGHPSDPSVTAEAPVVTAPAPARPRRRRAPVAAAFAGALAGGAAMALVLSDDPAAEGSKAAAPATLAGTSVVGSGLTDGGRTVDCAGRAVAARSAGCTVFQEQLGSTTLVAQRSGVVRRWSVRSATGELALIVLRRREGGYFQVARSRNEFAGNGGLHRFPTQLAVERGDRFGLTLLDGSGVGLVDGDGATGRWTPALAGLAMPPRPGSEGELLLGVEYEPGARFRPPPAIRGPAAARLSAGRLLARARTRYASGARVEVRLVAVNGRGALDLVRDGRRTVRSELPDLRLPLAPGATLEILTIPSSPEHAAVDVAYAHLGSTRLLSHYFDARGRRLKFVN